MKKTLIAFWFIVVVMSIAAQQIPVEIINQSEDLNGRVLVSKFREIIRNSSNYRICYDKQTARFIVQIDTMDRYKGDPSMQGVSTIYHYMVLIDLGDNLRLYCTNQLGYVGSSYLDQVAYEIYSELDNFVDSMAYYIINEW